MKTIAVASIILSLGTAFTCLWVTEQQAMSVFAARQAGFNQGYSLAKSLADRDARLSLCGFAANACRVRGK